MTLHRLLLRQLKRLGLVAEQRAQTDDAWRELLQRVSRAYDEHDQDRYLLERSQDLASKETAILYAAVRAERDLLETRVRERTEDLQLSQARLSSLVSLSAEWIWEQDSDLRFTFLSEGIESAAGVKSAELIGQRRDIDPGFEPCEGAIAEHQAKLQSRQAFRNFVYAMRRPNGERRYICISGEPVFDASGQFDGYRGVGSDVTAVTLSEQRIHELARYDGLTGLPNRNMFHSELERTIARAQRQTSMFAVCFMDLDRFKAINDSLGHHAGDALLKVVAGRLRASLRETDLVARLGGDEFVILIEGSDAPADLARVVNKVLAAISETITLQGHDLLVTASMGIASFPTDGNDAATLLKHADSAMYLAKERGKNNLQFYTAELAETAALQFALETDLRQAVASGELRLHYQPKIDIASGQMRGVEALLRWNHPVRGLVGPGEFISLAEERGLIVPIGRWVMAAACRQIQTWREAGWLPLPVAINLSARQFNSETLVSDLTGFMAQCGVSPSELEIELTESVLMTDPERASQVLQRLHDMGMGISIDDFGTGYSSLSYLKRFPAQTVKIDRSFVAGLPHDENDSAITQAVIAMAHSLGLKVVAEGVETAEQLNRLTQLGCDQAQGYLLGRPMPADALTQWLARQAPELGSALAQA